MNAAGKKTMNELVIEANNPKALTRVGSTRLLGCCPICLKQHPQSIPCENVTQPCKQCGKKLKHIEQWQALHRPSPLCADCYMRPNANYPEPHSGD